MHCHIKWWTCTEKLRRTISFVLFTKITSTNNFTISITLVLNCSWWNVLKECTYLSENVKRAELRCHQTNVSEPWRGRGRLTAPSGHHCNGKPNEFPVPAKISLSPPFQFGTSCKHKRWWFWLIQSTSRIYNLYNWTFT